jgi:hypothetical protein
MKVLTASFEPHRLGVDVRRRRRKKGHGPSYPPPRRLISSLAMDKEEEKHHVTAHHFFFSHILYRIITHVCTSSLYFSSSTAVVCNKILLISFSDSISFFSFFGVHSTKSSSLVSSSISSTGRGQLYEKSEGDD